MSQTSSETGLFEKLQLVVTEQRRKPFDGFDSTDGGTKLAFQRTRYIQFVIVKYNKL